MTIVRAVLESFDPGLDDGTAMLALGARPDVPARGQDVGALG